MTYNWYNLFNLTEWLATQLVSRTLTVFLDGIGQMDILVTQGNETGITVEDVFLPLLFGNHNPYAKGNWAIYKDANDDVWLGKVIA